jgi:hypothetical protein
MLVLLGLCETLPRVFVCVDALDECAAEQRQMVLQKVSHHSSGLCLYLGSQG